MNDDPVSFAREGFEGEYPQQRATKCNDENEDFSHQCLLEKGHDGPHQCCDVTWGSRNLCEAMTAGHSCFEPAGHEPPHMCRHENNENVTWLDEDMRLRDIIEKARNWAVQNDSESLLLILNEVDNV